MCEQRLDKYLFENYVFEPKCAITEKIAFHISENCVMAACPKCGQYIPAFDACAQLQCGRRDGQPYIPGSGCGTYFCAWCLGTSVDEGSCHDHVLECAMNPSNPK